MKFNWSQTTCQKVPINKIKINADVLGRLSLRQEAVEFYASLLDAGTKLKPIKLQKNTNLLIGGWHRIEAAKLVGKEKILALVGEVPDKDLHLEAFLDNQGHGVQYSKEERNKLIISMYKQDNKTQQEIAEVFGVTRTAISKILGVSNVKSDNTNANSETRADKRFKLTDQEKENIEILTFKGEPASNIVKTLLAENVEISESRIRQIKTAKIDEIRNRYRNGEGRLKIAESVDLSSGKLDEYLISDTDADPLDFELPVFTWWPAYGLDPRQNKHPGAIPVQLIKNLLAAFTKPGSHIVDIFAGGGTTAIACNDMVGRTCELFDLNPTDKSIKYHSIIDSSGKISLPCVKKKPDIIILDPPYGPQKQNEYSGNPVDLANLTPEIFVEMLNELFKTIKETWPPIKAALFMSAWRNKGELWDFPSMFSSGFSKLGYTIKEHIVNEVNQPASQGKWVAQAKEKRFFLRKHIHIIVAEFG